jgi:hypothetical protein
MAREMVESTPATRGEVDPDLYEQELTVDELRKAAAAAGFDLVPVEPEEGEASLEPAGNASAADWAAYARTRGATDEDLVDAEGKPLKRDALREKYQSPQSGD